VVIDHCRAIPVDLNGGQAGSHGLKTTSIWEINCLPAMNAVWISAGHAALDGLVDALNCVLVLLV
jgi:hypothetical protein